MWLLYTITTIIIILNKILMKIIYYYILINYLYHSPCLNIIFLRKVFLFLLFKKLLLIQYYKTFFIIDLHFGHKRLLCTLLQLTHRYIIDWWNCVGLKSNNEVIKLGLINLPLSLSVNFNRFLITFIITTAINPNSIDIG
jgi:hypothetical protein